jgi:hypothetical protein
MEGWLIFVIVLLGIWLISWLNNRVSSYKKELSKKAEEQKREEVRRVEEQKRREESILINDVLDGFDVFTEKRKIIKLLLDTLPRGYHCSRKGCNGILLKQKNNNFYVCSKCRNIRNVIRI